MSRRRRPASILAPSAVRQRPVLGLQVVQDARQLPELRGRLQQPQRVAGRRRVDDELVVGPRAREAQQLAQAHQLVDAGQRRGRARNRPRPRADRCRARPARAAAPDGAAASAPNARGASTSAARRRPRLPGTARSSAPSARPRQSPSEWAGSRETSRTRRPARARRQAMRGGAGGLADAALARRRSGPGPQPSRSLVLVAGERRLDARHLVAALARDGRRDAPPWISWMRSSRSASSSRYSSSDDLAQLAPHLRLQELLAQGAVVGQLGVDRRHQLVQHEAEPADQEAVDEDHSDPCARSSLRRMLTKL